MSALGNQRNQEACSSLCGLKVAELGYEHKQSGLEPTWTHGTEARTVCAGRSELGSLVAQPGHLIFSGMHPDPFLPPSPHSLMPKNSQRNSKTHIHSLHENILSAKYIPDTVLDTGDY